MFTALMIFGTRPEVVKLAPVHRELRAKSDIFRLVCCSTGQHRELLDQMLRVFKIQPDLDLDIIKHNQGLFHLTSSVLSRMEDVLNTVQPDVTIVQGDTSSAFAAALGSFYCRIPVAHVEAGLRSYDKFQPFPEEMNRVFISRIAEINFCPTHGAANNLAEENVDPSSIFVTGNTVIDALLQTLERLNRAGELEKYVDELKLTTERMILVTGHRRENFGGGLESVSQALLDLARSFTDTSIVYSVHPNPNVREPVEAMLSGHERIKIISPPDYLRFVSLMQRSYFLITDSGGIQEEAPSLKKPVLVTRSVTERPEAVECGAAKLVGTDRRRIVEEAARLLQDSDHYASMIVPESPFGDGRAARRIVKELERFLGNRSGEPTA